MWEAQWYPWEMTLLGVTPDGAQEGYGWIELAEEDGRLTYGVRRFWEKPSLPRAHTLWRQGALWNTFVSVCKAGTVWRIVWDVVPDIYEEFLWIRGAIGTSYADTVTSQIYKRLRAVNFSAGVCQPRPEYIRVLPVPQVGWSDWGSVECILTTCEQLGKKGEILARLRHRNGAAAFIDMPRPAQP
jgi:mannose-1-phosphate guanylyltransferase